MFGYIKVEKELFSKQERGLYQGFMCALCLSTKEKYQQHVRLCIGNDINLFNVLFHSILDIDPQTINTRCLMSVKKQTIISPNDLTRKISAGNIILMYYNLIDDIIDDKSTKKLIAKRLISKSYQKACQVLPDFDKKLRKIYYELLDRENKKESSLDLICDYSAQMTVELAKEILGEKLSHLAEILLYNLGKWIYLIDALDDLEKDYKSNRYNPLICSLKGFENGKQFVECNKDELEYIFYSTLNTMAGVYNDLQLTRFNCVLKKVFHTSLRQVTEKIFNKYLL